MFFSRRCRNALAPSYRQQNERPKKSNRELSSLFCGRTLMNKKQNKSYYFKIGDLQQVSVKSKNKQTFLHLYCFNIRLVRHVMVHTHPAFIFNRFILRKGQQANKPTAWSLGILCRSSIRLDHRRLVGRNTNVDFSVVYELEHRRKCFCFS